MLKLNKTFINKFGHNFIRGGGMKSSNSFLGIVIFTSLIFIVSACSPGQDTSAPAQTDSNSDDKTTETSSPPKIEDTAAVVSTPLWMTAELKDVRTGETFKVTDFKGKPVLLESFAVWCPICTQQQEEVKKLHADVGDDIITISLDTDQNEDEGRVLDHITKHDFTWYYAVSPIEVTRSLIDDFGPRVINAPLVPKILVCEDQSFKLLPFGVKSASNLKQTVAQECSA